MAKDLKTAFSEMSGFLSRNIRCIHKFVQSWSDYKIVQRVVAQILWQTNIMLMENTGKTVNNFPAALPLLDLDMASQTFKDPMNT